MASARAPTLLMVLTACLGVGLAWQIVPFQLDDAYITYRFAARFVAGEGLTYNPGGPWVEGFSSPVWLLALSAIAKLFGREHANMLPVQPLEALQVELGRGLSQALDGEGL